MRGFLARLLRNQEAATTVEYAVMLALLLGVVLGSVLVLGQDTKQLWTTNNTQMQAVGIGGS